jgi:hypothetical protein
MDTLCDFFPPKIRELETWVAAAAADKLDDGYEQDVVADALRMLHRSSDWLERHVKTIGRWKGKHRHTSGRRIFGVCLCPCCVCLAKKEYKAYMKLAKLKQEEAAAALGLLSTGMHQPQQQYPVQDTSRLFKRGCLLTTNPVPNESDDYLYGQATTTKWLKWPKSLLA